MRHDGRRRRRVARHHHGAHAQSVQFGDERRRVRARRVAERDEPDQLHRRRRSGRDRQHPETLSLEFLRRRRRGRRRLGEADDRGKGALHDALRARRPDPSTVASDIFVAGSNGTNLTSFGASETWLAAGGGANGGIDRILPAIRAGQRGQRQNVRLVEAGHGTNGRHRQRVARQRAGLVGAQHIHRRRFIHRGEAGRQDAQLCQGPRAERRRKGEGGRQRHRYRCQNRRQDEGDDLGERHLEKPGIGHQHHDDDAVEHGEIAHHAQHRLLLGADDMGGADQLRGAAELGARAGRRDLRHRLAAPHQRPGIGLHARAGFDGHRFAGEHGLVEQDFAAGEAHIRGDHAAERQLHHIARHQLGRGHGLPRAVAPDRRVQREPRLQRGEGRLGAALLKQPERGVEHQETGDDRGLDIFAEHQLEHDRRFEHPRNRRPEFSQAPCATDAAAVSGIALGPNFSSRWRASSLVRPLGGRLWRRSPTWDVKRLSRTSGRLSA